MILASLLGQSFESWRPDRRPHTSVQIFHVLEQPGYCLYCRRHSQEKMVSPGFHFLVVYPLSAEDGAGCQPQFGGGGEEGGCLNRGASVRVLPLMPFFPCVILCRVPGTRPIAALCLPLRIFPMRMISARNLARHLLLPETHYRGICLNMRDQKERFTGARCWTPLTEQSLG